VLALVITLLTLNNVSANEIYITQSGDNLQQDVEQDGENNQIKGISQTNMKLDGDFNVMINHQFGNNHLQEVEIDGDSNYSVAVQGGGGDDDSIQMKVTGKGNYTGVFQGFHYDGLYSFTTDTDETGGHEASVTVTGDYNDHLSTQTDTNRGDGGGDSHYLDNTITGDFNTVRHTQMGKAGHDGWIDIDGDFNDVTLYQRGNDGKKWTEIELTGDGHTVDVNQRGSQSATATIDLTNSGGAYTLDLDQNVTTSADSYSITGTCATFGGCSVTVNRNN